MCGGGRTVRRGRMGRSATVATASVDDIQTLETDLASLENRLHLLQQKRNDLTQKLSVLEPELREMRLTYETCSKELKVR